MTISGQIYLKISMTLLSRVSSFILFLFIFLFVASSDGNASESSHASRPNILFIMVDDLGYGDLSSYGALDLQTPNIDQLAAEGMKWTRFYANCPVCSPTRAALMTGLFPDQAGVPGVIRTHSDNSWGYLDPNTPTIAEDLQTAGYKTALIGKWHLGLESPNLPNQRGFKLFHGWLGDMMDDYYTHRRHGINYLRLNDKTIDPSGHATDLFTDWAVEYIHQQAERQKSGNSDPFFLYLAYNAPHTPIQPPADWLEKTMASHPDMSPARAKLVALIEHMDVGIGKALNALKANNLEQNTLVVFTSDNGGQLNVGANNGGLKDGKQSMYEGGLRVPCIVRWPGKIRADSTTSSIGITSDWKWTLQSIGTGSCWEILSAPPEAIDLRSALFENADPNHKRTLYFCRREGGLRYGGKTIEAVIQNEWKLLQNSPFQNLELYNLNDDPFEQNELSDSNPGKVAELNKLLRFYIQQGGTVPWFKTSE